MSRGGIEQLLYMMDQAFEGDIGEALMGNLRAVPPGYWSWMPPDGHRSIRSLVQELGECKYVYDSHAFGDGSMHWDKPGTVPEMPKGGPAPEAIEWLRGAHTALRGHLAAMEDDSALTEQVMSQWGRLLERRFLIKTTIEHDLYHAGEINHIRALAQGND